MTIRNLIQETIQKIDDPSEIILDGEWRGYLQEAFHRVLELNTLMAEIAVRIPKDIGSDDSVGETISVLRELFCTMIKLFPKPQELVEAAIRNHDNCGLPDLPRS